MSKSTFTGRSAPEPLQVATKFSRTLVKEPLTRSRIRSIVVFGSALRRQDFVENLSDVDVLVLVNRRTKRLTDRVRRSAHSIDSLISPVLFSVQEFMHALEAGEPGSLLMLRGEPLYDTGAFSEAKGSGFEPTKKTVRTLIDHAFYALSIALNDYFSGLNLLESINCAYHCARHALRAVIINEADVLAESNEQIMQMLSEYPQLGGAFDELVSARTSARKLINTYSDKQSRNPSITLQNGIGKLLLDAEGVAIKSCEMCLKRKPDSLRELLRKAQQKFGECEITSISWRSPGWELLVKRNSELKHISISC